MKKSLDDSISTAIVHTIDRLTEFFVRASAAKTIWNNEYIELLQFDRVIRDFWIDRGFTEDILEERYLIDSAWDLLQCNFRFERPAEFLYDDRIEHAFCQNIAEFRNRYVNAFKMIDLPVLERLRAAELLRPFELDSTIQAACGLFSKEFRCLSEPSNGELKQLPTDLSDVIEKLLRRYPIFLYPSARMFFFAPSDVGMNSEGFAPAFGATYDISAEDFLEALDEYKFRFQMARRYLSPSCDGARLSSDWKITDQLAKAFIGKPTRSNEYVSQKNSIAVTLCSMRVWELVHAEGKDVSEAIDEVAQAFGKHDKAARNKKVADRYFRILEKINDVAERYRADYGCE
jgi:hypothetical protein